MLSRLHLARRSDKLKLVAIPLLLIALVFVALPKDDAKQSGPLKVNGPNNPRIAVAGKPAVSRSTNPATKIVQRDWPRLQLSDVMVYDPFSNREHARTRALASQPDDSNVIRSVAPQQRTLPVSVYYQNAKTVSALADGELLRIGDLFEVSWTVSAITRQHVTLIQVGASAEQ